MLPNQFNSKTFAAFKRCLRMVWPEVRSSHADQALASYCGHRTYASLVAAMPAPPDVMAFVPQPARLMERLGELGYHLPKSGLDKVGTLFQSEMMTEIWKHIAQMADASANDNGTSAP